MYSSNIGPHLFVALPSNNVESRELSRLISFPFDSLVFLVLDEAVHEAMQETYQHRVGQRWAKGIVEDDADGGGIFRVHLCRQGLSGDVANFLVDLVAKSKSSQMYLSSVDDVQRLDCAVEFVLREYLVEQILTRNCDIDFLFFNLLAGVDDILRRGACAHFEIMDDLAAGHRNGSRFCQDHHGISMSYHEKKPH